MTGDESNAATDARTLIERDGVTALRVDDLTTSDLERIGWSGDPHHLEVVRDVLDRIGRGEQGEYLAARLPDGTPVAKLWIDYGRYPDGGYLSQFATNPDLQGLGIGSFLMAGAEDRVRAAGRPAVRIGVERDNPRAQALYERLGYEAVGEDVEHWGRTGADGTLVMHRAEVILMRKMLS
jgi:ribosomal protein S18 acetylase RimI-like enzyme